MSTFGSVTEFHDKQETWQSYVARLNEYFIANGITNATKKRAILNSVIGANTFKLLEGLIAPREPKEATFEEICTLLAEHFTPHRNMIVARYQFNSRARHKDESIALYIAALRDIAKDCKYEQTLEEMLRDRLVCGINNDKIQKSLLAQGEKLTYKKAIEVAQSVEIADEQYSIINAGAQSQVDSFQLSHNYNKQYNWNKRKQQPRSGPSTNRQGQNKSSGLRTNCRNCGTQHPPRSCPAYGKECRACHKHNHYAQFCRSSKPKQIHTITEEYDYYDNDYYYDEQLETEIETLIIDNVEVPNTNNEISSKIIINGESITLKLDTGAKCNVMSLTTFKRVAKTECINPSKKTTLIAFGGTAIASEGVATLQCHGSTPDTYDLQFHVINKPVQTLLGLRDCLRMGLISLGTDVYQISHTDINPFKEYSDLFDNALGKLPVTYSMTVDKAIVPVVRPPRRVPAAMQTKVENELKRMTKLGVIVPISKPTRWVSSMVATRKHNSEEIRLCIDPRDLNKALKRPHHPTKTVEEVAANMKGATIFSILDAKSSFWQIPLDYESSILTTFSTPHGRYRYLRMPFGLNSSSDVYQSAMNQLFADQPCSIIVDDILIGGRTKQEHDANLKSILDRARKLNLKLNPNKCKFGVQNVNYVGHTFTSEGLKPDPTKISAIKEMNTPDSTQSLQRYLGMLNYLAKFIPNLSTVAAPLRELTHNNVQWCWYDKHQKAYEQLQSMICNAPLLKYYDVRKAVTLTCDASQFGLGAACLQNGEPIAYASRTMTPCEQNYAQIEKELLAVVFACNKFYDYIYGKPTTVETDHKPLIAIMNKPMFMIPARLQRMILQLQRYDISLVYKKGVDMFVADTLSRAPSSNTKQSDDEKAKFEVMAILPITPSKLKELSTSTANDKTLQQLSHFIKTGWPIRVNNVSAELRQYYPYKEELSIDDNNIVMKGMKAIIPKSLQANYAKRFHDGHIGAEATKRRARDIVFWPKMSQEIDNLIERCSVCNSTKAHLQKEPLQSHPIPTLPWETVGVDLFHWNHHDYVAIGDKYSNWFDMEMLQDITSYSVIQYLKKQFAIHGTPNTLISDNGKQFACHEFNEFVKSWNIHHITSSPQYPQSNGLAESAVKRSKQLLEKTEREQSDLYRNLLNIRNVPTQPTLASSAQRLMSRRLRTTIPTNKQLLKPTMTTGIQKQLRKKQQQNKSTYDKSAKPLRKLRPGQVVRLQTPKGFNQLGTILKSSTNPRSYIVNTNGTALRRNRRHIIPVSEPNPVFTKVNNNSDTQPSHVEIYQPPLTTRYGRVIRPNPRYDL